MFIFGRLEVRLKNYLFARASNSCKQILLLDLALLPCSIVFHIASLLHFLFSRIFPTKGLKSKLIICGGLTIAGSGKTSFCAFAIKEIKKSGHRVCYIGRGYGTNSKQKKQSMIYGDEATLLSRLCDVYVGNVQKLIYEIDGKYDYIITDSGFWDKKIKNSQKVAVIDGGLNLNYDSQSLGFPFSVFHPLHHLILKEVDLFFIIEPKENYSYFTDSYHKKIVNAQNQVANLNDIKPITDSKQEAIAFSGLANNQKFFSFVESLGINLIKTIPFPDHHNYTAGDEKYLIKLSLKKILITTAKDAVKLSPKFLSKVKVVELDLTLSKNSQKSWKGFL